MEKISEMSGVSVSQISRVERGESIEVLKSRTGWFKVRTDKGKEGWVRQEDMVQTLTASGATPYSMFEAGDLVQVERAEDLTNDGFYTIDTATGTVLTFTSALAVDNADDETLMVTLRGR